VISVTRAAVHMEEKGQDVTGYRGAYNQSPSQNENRYAYEHYKIEIVEKNEGWDPQDQVHTG